MNVDEMTLEQLRVAIAERLGWRWMRRNSEDGLTMLVPPFARQLGAEKGGVPFLVPSSASAERYCDWLEARWIAEDDTIHTIPHSLPDWPNDINEAWKLESRLDRAGQNAYILELLKPGAVGGSGERRMFDFVHATAEERCRAWLKATVSE